MTGLELAELLVEAEPVDPKLVEDEPVLAVLVEPDELVLTAFLTLPFVEITLAVVCFASAGS